MKFTKSLFILIALVLAGLNQAWAENENYKKGIDLYNRSDWIGAIPYFEKAADEGVVEAQRRLGYILWKGGADEVSAGRWLKSAVDAGDLEARAYYLSFLAENADNELTQNSESRAWLEGFSDQVDIKNILARTYEAEDASRALVLYQELVEEGYAPAIKRLIKANVNGELGLNIDLDRAEELAKLLP